MYQTENFTYSCWSDVGLCHGSSLTDLTEPCHQGSHSFAKDASQCCWVHSLLHSCMSVSKSWSLFPWFQAVRQMLLFVLPCILDALVASFVCGRSPWPMPDSPWCPRLVSYWVRVSAHWVRVSAYPLVLSAHVCLGLACSLYIVSLVP